MSPNPNGAATNPILSLLPFLLIIVIIYFLMIRPQQKKQKQREAMLSTLEKGDKIVTVGGVHGTVKGFKESTVIVQIDDNVKIEIDKSAVSTIKRSSSEKAETKESK
jgi:preprotein translocase subunit YajC